MGTTVKVSDNFKKELNKLQAKVTLKTGGKISQNELLDRIVQFIITNEEQFFQEIIFNWKPLSDSEWEDIADLIADFGVDTDEQSIDRELYGEQ